MSRWMPNASLVFLLLLMAFPACSASSRNVPKQVCFSGQCVNVEVARTQEERTRGLQDRQSLGKDKGMLFIFQKSQKQNFWMKDTFISLDIVWMDRNKKIVFIIPNILPCKTEKCPVYKPEKDALYVLEVNAGATIELGLKVGDQAVFR